MIKLYQEPNGDFVAMETDTIAYYRMRGRPELRECRATALAGDVLSVCTTNASVDFLKRCRRVSFDDVPADWIEMLGASREEVIDPR